jgi:hypothetical protein
MVERQIANRPLEELPRFRCSRRLVRAMLIVCAAAVHHALGNPTLLRHWSFLGRSVAPDVLFIVEKWGPECDMPYADVAIVERPDAGPSS